MTQTFAKQGRRAWLQRARRGVSVLTSAALVMCMLGVPAGGVRAWAASGNADDSSKSSALIAGATDLATQATKVDLYRITVTGGIGGAIGVGDALAAKATKLKTVQGTTSTVEADVEADDDVSYQWQYANTNTTADSAFTDIEGATAATYSITSDMVGKYLRVKATSNNTVVSTKKPYYGSTQSVSPVGPVQEAAGAVQLSSVSLVSTLSNSMWVGATITPTAKYTPSGSYVEQAVPQDASVTYTWEVADSPSGPFTAFDSTTYAQSSVSASGELTVGADLCGKYVRLKANALMNTVSSLTWPVLPQGVYDLMRITFGFDTLYSGGSIVTALQAKTLDYENDYSFGTTVPPGDPNTSYQWYSTSDEPVRKGDSLDFSACTWTELEGATGADLTIPDSAVGCYVKVVATSSKDGIGTSVERASTTRVRAGGSLEQALGKLEFFHPKPVWNTATNMNAIVAEKLASVGYTDVTVKTKSAKRNVESDVAHLGVSTANDATNGDVQFFTYDNAAAASSHSFSSYHQITITFELSREGEDPVDFTCTTNIPWDLDAAQGIFDEQVKGLAVGFADGEDASGVTQDLTLPCKAGILWTTWSSSDEESVRVYRDESSAGAFWDPYTGIVNRGNDDAQVVLTASVDATLIDTADDTLKALSKSFEFPVTVKGNPDMVAEMNATLAQAIGATFVYDNVKDFATGATVAPENVDADLSLPNTRVLFANSGLNSSDYRVSYASDNESGMTVNGYRTFTLRPLPSAGNAAVNLTLTVSHKTVPGVSYSKTLAFTVPALDEAEIDADLAYLQQAADAIFEGYSEGKQDQSAVVSDLHPFQRVYVGADGQLHWKYNYSSTEDANCPIGFAPRTVAENPGGSDASYERFVSSHPGIVADGSLLVVRPSHDIGVSITCCLSSDRFGAYYDRYKADPDCSDALKEKFRQLYRTIVPCQFTVKGTQVSAAVRQALLDAADEAQAVAESAEVSLDGADVLENMQWVDSETMGALQNAIAKARAVAAKEDVTDSEIAAAGDELNQARAAFESAVKPGLRAFATALQKQQLAADVAAAEQVLNSAYTSDDGAEVLTTRMWVPFDAANRLADAVDVARALADADSVAAAEVRAASDELAAACAVFKGSMAPGLKEPVATAAERRALVDAADAAEADAARVVESADGADLMEDVSWAPADAKVALQAAIAAARDVAASDELTGAQARAASDALAQAVAAFEAEVKTGARTFAKPADRVQLALSAGFADALLASAYASADGADVPAAAQWVPTSAAERLAIAIDEAIALASADGTPADELAVAAAELSDARAAFEAALKPGTMAAPEGDAGTGGSGATSDSGSGADTGGESGSSTPSSGAGEGDTQQAPIGGVAAGKKYAAGSGASRATYLVKSAATASTQGVAWYVSTKVSAKTGKVAVVPATVKINGGTYRVEQIAAGAFANMKALKKVTIGAKVSKIAKGAFKSTPKLKRIVVKSSVLKGAASVKGALKGSKAGKVVVKVPAASKVAYKKIFTKKNLKAPKAVTVK